MRSCRHSKQLAVIASLIFSSAVCVGLLFLRATHSHNRQYVWLIWNLLLAWIPVACALAIFNLQRRRPRLLWPILFGGALVWFVFFPNAPYLLTDLIHLQPRPDAPFWFDLILFVSFAWSGFMLGLVSLVLMQEVIRRIAGTIVSWVFAFVMLALSSFGIYLGRFLRWNSWDLFFNPLELTGAILEGARHPLFHLQTIVFSTLFACLLLAMYLTLMAIVRFQQSAKDFPIGTKSKSLEWP
jgi:uncharacterized membrane protein